MPITPRIVAILFTTLLSFPPLAAAQPAPGPSVPVRKPMPRFDLNGHLDVGTECLPEFHAWSKKISFYERPFRLCVRWRDKQPATWARWYLFRRGKDGQPDVQIASKALPASALTGTDDQFVIDLTTHLPQFNTGDKSQQYVMKLSSTPARDEGKPRWASAAILEHLPKAGQPQPQMGKPYQCPIGKYPRDVRIWIPQMTVNQTSSTPGDGDRDEVYFSIGRIGPGADSRQVRQPYGDDSFYRAYDGKTVFESSWRNEDDKHRMAPQLFSNTLEHGQTVTMAVRIGEADDGTLASIQQGLQTALDGIADVAKNVPGYGTIVAAAAKAGSAAAGLLPDNTKDDVIGFATVHVTNKCGYIQTSWVTFGRKSFPGAGTISNDFLDIEDHDAYEAHLAVLNSEMPGFWSDYGPFSFVGAEDAFFWVARGTHDSGYTFLVKQSVTTP